jgi:tetratricopeptide (TPR) repeat protein
MKRTDEAERYYKHALALDPDYIPALLNMAGLYISKGDNQKATFYLKQILKIQPENTQAKSVLKTLNRN